MMDGRDIAVILLAAAVIIAGYLILIGIRGANVNVSVDKQVIVEVSK